MADAYVEHGRPILVLPNVGFYLVADLVFGARKSAITSNLVGNYDVLHVHRHRQRLAVYGLSGPEIPGVRKGLG